MKGKCDDQEEFRFGIGVAIANCEWFDGLDRGNGLPVLMPSV